MTNYTLISTNKELYSLVDFWKQTNVVEIAVDFEGEFNLHCYGEHLCLIQIFDNVRFYIIDPQKIDTESLRYFLETPWLKKIWFDCTSDGALVWKKYHIQIAGICDLYPVSKILNSTGNLSSLVARFCPESTSIIKPGSNKKKNQMTNWMLRPLSSEQLIYALSDVAYLFVLREAFLKLAENLHKSKQVKQSLNNPPHIKTKETPGYEKLPGYLRMNSSQQTYLHYFFEAREIVAKAFNKAPFMIMDKHDLVAMSRHVPFDESNFTLIAKCRSKAIEQQLIPLLMQAKIKAESQIRNSIH